MADGRVPRGRPRRFETDRLLDRSLEVFWRHGLAGTTTRILEDELGISQSSLYNAYGSKDGLLDRSVDRYVAKLNAAVLSPLEDPGRDAIIQFVDAVVDWVGREEHPGCLVMNLAAEDAGQGHRLVAFRARLAQALRASVRTFTGADDLIEARTDLLVAAVLGLSITARSGAGGAELRRIGRAIERQVADW